jgi:hypothetical protein
MDHHELNNFQLEKILNTDKCTREKFLGIFSIDTLPSKVNSPSCFIFNTDRHDGPGEHWIAVYVDKTCYFFDPLGFSPQFYGLSSYFKKLTKNLVFNKARFQPFYSRKCGYYSFLFLLFKCRSIRVRLSELLIKKYFGFK